MNVVWNSEDAKTKVLTHAKEVASVDSVTLIEQIEDCANKVLMFSRGETAPKVEFSEVSDNLAALKSTLNKSECKSKYLGMKEVDMLEMLKAFTRVK